MNIAATPAATPPPAARPAPAPTPSAAPSRPAPSPMNRRAAPGQKPVPRIPEHSIRAHPENTPDVQVPIDDGDLGGYTPADINYDKPTPKPAKPAPETEVGGDEPADDTDATPAPKPEDKKPDSLTADLGEPDASDEDDTPTDGSPAPAPTPGKKDARNYAAFTDPTMEKIARSLPNHLYAEFARLAPQWKAAMDELPKLREIASKKPSFHYEHQDGYMLSDEWNAVKQSYNVHQNEVNHWDRQLLAIENGEPWRDLIGYDQQGNPQYAEIPAPKDGRVDIRARLHAQNARMRADHGFIQAQNQAAQIVNGYGEKRRIALETVKEHKRKLFPNIDPEKLEGDDKASYDLAGKLIAEIDPSFEKHPATDFARLMYVTLMRVSRQGIKWKQELDKAKANLKGKTRSQNTVIPSGGGEEGDESDDLIPIERD